MPVGRLAEADGKLAVVSDKRLADVSDWKQTVVSDRRLAELSGLAKVTAGAADGVLGETLVSMLA